MADPTIPRCPATYIFALFSIPPLFYNPFFEIFGQVRPNLFTGPLNGHFCHVGIDHDPDQLLKTRPGRIPPQFGLCLGRVSQKIHYIRRTVEIRRNRDQAPCLSPCRHLSRSWPSPTNSSSMPTYLSKIAKFTAQNAVRRGDDEIFRLVVLENQPHTFYVVFGIAPVAERRQVA